MNHLDKLGLSESKMRLKMACLWIIILMFQGCSEKAPAHLVKPDTNLDVAQRRAMLIGTWYGERETKDHGLTKWINNRYDNGTYKVTFYYKDSNNINKSHTEVGDWGVSGNIYFIIMKGWIVKNNFERSDPRDPYYYDAYEINFLSASEMHYENVENKNSYKVVRVRNDFEVIE